MTRRVSLVLLAPVLALLLASCVEDGFYAGALVSGGTHVVEPEDALRGVVVVSGGELRIPQAARAGGSVYVLGGRVEVDGEVTGDVYQFGGDLLLGPTATVGGSLNVGGGTFDLADGAVVGGDTNVGDVQLPFDAAVLGPTPSERLVQQVVQTLVVAAFATLLVAFVPHPAERVTEAISRHWAVSGAIGLLSGVVGLVLVVFMAFTIILIPVALILLIVLGLAVVLGWTGFGVLIGERLADWRGWRWPPAAKAGVGTFLFMLGLSALTFMPVLGAVLSIPLVVIGFGAVLLTRFGFQRFVPESEGRD